MKTRDKILEAARHEFLEFGFDATRMRSIAERAEINKGLLHYYFKSKETLLVEVFESTFHILFTTLGEVFESDLSLDQKIRQGVKRYMDFMNHHPRLPIFIINEMDRDAKRHANRLKQAKVKPPFGILAHALEQGKNNGVVRPDLESREFIISMISLMLFPYVGKSMLKFAHNLNEEKYKSLIEQRQNEIADQLIRIIKP